MEITLRCVPGVPALPHTQQQKHDDRYERHHHCATPFGRFPSGQCSPDARGCCDGLERSSEGRALSFGYRNGSHHVRATHVSTPARSKHGARWGIASLATGRGERTTQLNGHEASDVKDGHDSGRVHDDDVPRPTSMEPLVRAPHERRRDRRRRRRTPRCCLALGSNADDRRPPSRKSVSHRAERQGAPDPVTL